MSSWEAVQDSINASRVVLSRVNVDELLDPDTYKILGTPSADAFAELLSGVNSGPPEDELTKAQLIRRNDRFSALIRAVDRLREMKALQTDAAHPGWSEIRSIIVEYAPKRPTFGSRNSAKSATAASSLTNAETLGVIANTQKRIDLIESRLQQVTPEGLAQLQTRLEDQAERFAELERATQILAETAGVTSHAKEFGETARAYGDDAASWLKRTTFLAVLTSVYALVVLALYIWGPAPDTVPQLVQASLAKLVLLSILVSATLWSAANFRSNKHNETVNRHRQNALQSFRAFAGSTDDPATKDAVLLHATACIFGHQDTTYAAQIALPASSLERALSIGRRRDADEE